MFLVRFDDICPTMNWHIWDQIEAILRELNIKPILAVIPDNQDLTFKYCKERTDFWDRVRGWQELGWSIGIHGYQHLYVTGDAGMLGGSPRSEFAGLGYEEQKRKLERAIEIFSREKIESRLWIAPSHSFDETTLRVLKELGITIISDGLSCRPYVDLNGLTWVPVQVSKFKKIYSLCTWTVCLHHNEWTQKQFDRFRHDIMRFHSKVTSLDDVLNMYGRRSYSLADAAFKYVYKYALRVRGFQQRFIAPEGVAE